MVLVVVFCFKHLCPAAQASEIDERRIQSCVHFMTLKKLNRLAHIRLKKGRDQTHEVQSRLGGDEYRLGFSGIRDGAISAWSVYGCMRTRVGRIKHQLGCGC